MIYDARSYDQPLAAPPYVRVYRPRDGKWFDPDARAWVDKPVATRVLAYSRPAPDLFPNGYTLRIDTPADVWGINEEVCVFISNPNTPKATAWEDWFYATANPAVAIDGGHNVWDGKKWIWQDFRPVIQ